jgi:hypothetical protein
MANNRRRTIYAQLTVATIALGLLSRHLPTSLPTWIAKDPGDVLYATMIYWLARVCCPGVAKSRSAATSLAICVAIEFLKLWHAPWLDAFRVTTIGRLTLGVGFHVSNLVCYALGIGLALAIDARIGTGHKNRFL